MISHQKTKHAQKPHTHKNSSKELGPNHKTMTTTPIKVPTYSMRVKRERVLSAFILQH